MSNLSYTIFDDWLQKHATEAEKNYIDNYTELDDLGKKLDDYSKEAGEPFSLVYCLNLENFSYLDLHKLLFLARMQKVGLSIAIIYNKRYLRAHAIQEYSITEYFKVANRFFELMDIRLDDIQFIDQDEISQKLQKDHQYASYLRYFQKKHMQKMLNNNLQETIDIIDTMYLANFGLEKQADIILFDIDKFEQYQICQEIIRAHIDDPASRPSYLMPIPQLPLFTRGRKDPISPGLYNRDELHKIMKSARCSISDTQRYVNLFLDLFADVSLVKIQEILKLGKQYEKKLQSKLGKYEYELKMELVTNSLDMITEQLIKELKIESKPEFIDIKGSLEIFEALRNKLRFEIFSLVMNARDELEYAELLEEIKKTNPSIDPSTISKAVKRLELANLIRVKDIEGSRTKYLKAMAKSINITL